MHAHYTLVGTMWEEIEGEEKHLTGQNWAGEGGREGGQAKGCLGEHILDQFYLMS